MSGPHIDLPPPPRIAEFCRKHGIRRMALFGSVLRDDFRPGTDSPSDVDFLVEFEPGRVVGLIRLAGIERELSALLGRKADVRSPQELSRYFRDEVVRSAVVLYAA
jgi:uncharacterized protein